MGRCSWPFLEAGFVLGEVANTYFTREQVQQHLFGNFDHLLQASVGANYVTCGNK